MVYEFPERQNAHGIAANPEKCRMAQTDQPAQPKRQVQPHSRQCKDRGAGDQRDQKRLVQRKGQSSGHRHRQIQQCVQ